MENNYNYNDMNTNSQNGSFPPPAPQLPPNKMKTCKYCKSQIDKKATVCPVCKKSQNSSLGCGCLCIIVLFGFLFFLIGSSGRSKTSDRGSTRVEPNTSSQSAEKTENSGNDTPDGNSGADSEAENNDFSYEITDTRFTYYTNSIGNIEYYGIVEITNTGQTNIYMDDCTFDIEDNDGHLLQTDKYISTCPSVIAPGEKGYFYNSIGSTHIDSSVSLDNGVNLVPNYKVEKANGDIVNFDVSDTDTHEDNLGNLKITGRVTNNTAEDCSYLYVNVLFYDANDKILSITGTSITDLTAGSTTSFEASTMFSDDSVDKSSIARYEVIARAKHYQW